MSDIFIDEKAEKVEKFLYFKVDFDWATDFARDLWSEHSFDKAYNFLNDMGIPTRELQDKIIAGQMKMIQDPDGKEGADGMLAPDNWQPNPNRCHHSLYPDPTRIIEFLTAQNKLAQQTVPIVGERISSLIKRRNSLLKRNALFHKSSQRDEVESINFYLMSVPDEVYEWLGLDKDYLEIFPFFEWNKESEVALNYIEDRELSKSHKPRSSLLPQSLSIPGVNPQEILDNLLEDIKTEHDPTLSSQYGIIDENGKFYPCKYMQHEALAQELGYKDLDDAVDNYGCIAISKSMVTSDWVFQYDYDAEITQKQKDTLFDFAQKYDILENQSVKNMLSHSDRL